MKVAQKKASAKRGGAVRDITVKRVKQDDSFRVHRIEDAPSVEPLMEHHQLSSASTNDDFDSSFDQEEQEVEEVLEEATRTEQTAADVEPRDFVRVKFPKFVQLISSRDCSEVVNANGDEDIVMSSNLLTELAGTHDEKGEKKIPLVFLVGLAIGVVLTYFLIAK